MAGFGFVRVFTGPIRAHYERAYKRVRRLARVVFLLDAALMIVVVCLALLIISLVIRPVSAPDIDVQFDTPDIAAAAPTPVTIRLRSTSDNSHSFVRLRWRLPSGVQILDASAPFDAQGLISVGELPAHGERVIHAVIRAFHPEGSPLTFSFYVETSDQAWGTRIYGADAIRVVRGSAVTVDLPQGADVPCASREGAVLPLRIRNVTAQMIPSVELRPLESSSSTLERIVLGNISPHETRFVFVPIVASADGLAHLDWELFATSRSLQTGSWSVQTVDWNEGDIESPLIAQPDVPAEVRVRHVAASSSLLAVLPSSDELFFAPILSSASSIELPSSGFASSTHQRWMTAIVSDRDGKMCLGPATFGVFRSAFPFRQRIQYTSESGDQIGAGPIPFVVGEETRMWVLWHIGPIDSALRSVHASARLPNGVTATGNVMAPDGGSWKTTDRIIEWSAPRMDTDAPEALFGFEIAVRPSETSSTMPLIGEASVDGVDVSTETILHVRAPALGVEDIDK